MATDQSTFQNQIIENKVKNTLEDYFKWKTKQQTAKNLDQKKPEGKHLSQWMDTKTKILENFWDLTKIGDCFTQLKTHYTQNKSLYDIPPLKKKTNDTKRYKDELARILNTLKDKIKRYDDNKEPQKSLEKINYYKVSIGETKKIESDSSLDDEFKEKCKNLEKSLESDAENYYSKLVDESDPTRFTQIINKLLSSTDKTQFDQRVIERILFFNEIKKTLEKIEKNSDQQTIATDIASLKSEQIKKETLHSILPISKRCKVFQQMKKKNTDVTKFEEEFLFLCQSPKKKSQQVKQSPKIRQQQQASKQQIASLNRLLQLGLLEAYFRNTPQRQTQKFSKISVSDQNIKEIRNQALRKIDPYHSIKIDDSKKGQLNDILGKPQKNKKREYKVGQNGQVYQWRSTPMVSSDDKQFIRQLWKKLLQKQSGLKKDGS